MQRALLAKQQHSAFGWHHTALIGRDQLERSQRLVVQRVDALKQLSGRSHVQIIHAQFRHWQLVKSHALSRAAQFINQRLVGLPVGRTQTHINAMLRPFSLEPMRPRAADKHLHHQQGFALHGD